MDDNALLARVETVTLFCRVTPAQKNCLILHTATSERKVLAIRFLRPEHKSDAGERAVIK